MNIKIFMNYLALELRSEALDSSSSILNLLRKASVIAYKLNVQELQEWVNRELKGYTDYSLIPEYRFVRGELIALNHYHDWIPVNITHAKLSRAICTRPFSEKISYLEDVVDRASENDLIVPIPKETEQTIMKWTDTFVPFKLHITVSQIKMILESVRNNILDWSLRLEKNGILEKGMTLSLKESEIVSNTNFRIENFYNNSPTGNTMSENNIFQSHSSMGIGVNHGKVITEELGVTINEAQPQNLAQAAADIRQLLEQLSSDNPTDTLSEKAIVAEKAIKHIENDSKFKQRVINAVKTGSLGAFKKLIGNNPIGAFFIEGIKGWREIE